MIIVINGLFLKERKISDIGHVGLVTDLHVNQIYKDTRVSCTWHQLVNIWSLLLSYFCKR